MNRRRQRTIKRNALGRLLDAAQRRFSRARPGSVLVMVVALLVMLALIGTAAMSTARLDRMSSVQHVKNTQLDIMADGVKNMAISVVVDDLFNGNGLYRDVATDQTTYDNYDFPGSDPVSDDSDTNTLRADGVLNKSFDAWLGSRLPEAIGNVPAWPYVSYTPFRSGTGYQVDAPNIGVSGFVTIPKTVYKPTYLNINGVDLPALQVVPAGVADPFGDTSNKPFLAGDADGDGVADSLYFKLGVIGNITYYGAYRIIDNNSAINVNTAMVRDGDFAGDPSNTSPNPPRIGNDGFFTTNVGMAEFLKDYNYQFKKLYEVSPEFTNMLNNRKMPVVPSGMNGGSGNPIPDDPTPPAPPITLPPFAYRTLGDAVYMGLARRPDFPGYVAAGKYYGNGTRPYGLGDAFALAYRFCLGNGGATASPLELDLATSAYPDSFIPYAPAASSSAAYTAIINKWYLRNFDYSKSYDYTATPTKQPVRSVFVTYNPTSNAAPSHVPANQVLYPDPGMTAIGQTPIKISLNTAQFGDLWRGFYEVMCTDAITTGIGVGLKDATQNDALALSQDQADPYYGGHFDAGTYKNTLGELHSGRMFRSPLRGDGTTVLTPRQVMAMRSAIAAWHTVALRKGASRNALLPITPQYVTLIDSNNKPEFQATIYHGAPQPFITEIYAQTDINKVIGNSEPTDPINAFKDKQNPRGFVAIEIYNPYNVAIDLTDWRIGRIDRSSLASLNVDRLRDSTGAAQTIMKFVRYDPANPNGQPIDVTTIGPGQRLVIHNFKPGVPASDKDWAQYPPPGGVIPIDPKMWIQVKELPSVMGKQGVAGSNNGSELVLLRPSTKTPNNPGANDSTALKEYATMVPVDSYDFTGLSLPASEGQGAEGWHYCRTNDEADRKRWTFVYPGRYDGKLNSRRHQGTEYEQWFPAGDPNTPGSVGVSEPWSVAGSAPNINIRLGLADPNSTRNLNAGNNVDDPYDFPIQLFATDTPGPAVSPAQFPFGGFARAGDIMQVPFISSYVIRKLKPDGTLNDPKEETVVEMNSVTMDSVFAEDTDPDDDDVEDIGRFAPVVTKPNAAPNAAHAVNDLDFASKTASYAGTSTPRYNYHWATRILDYFTTINNPNDDYLPNVDPVANAGVQAVPNGPKVTNIPQANKGNEDTTPIEGLINLNTASTKVLSAVPFVPASITIPGSPPTYDSVSNADIAQSITNYRDVNDPVTGKPHGPFTTLFELDRVPIYAFVSNPAAGAPFLCYYRDIWNPAAATTPRDADDDDGDFTPLNNGSPRVDGVIDFEDRYLAINRLSNILTLRSDTFTAYILVQGWRNAGSTNPAQPPTLEGQRRLAVIIDRSRITPVKKTATVFNVPTAN